MSHIAKISVGRALVVRVRFLYFIANVLAKREEERESEGDSCIEMFPLGIVWPRIATSTTLHGAFVELQMSDGMLRFFTAN